MSSFGSYINYVMSKPIKNGKKRLPRDKWEAKLREEGKWVNYSKKNK